MALGSTSSTLGVETDSREGEAGGGGEEAAIYADEGRGSGAHGPRKLTIAVKPLSWSATQRSVRDMERRGSSLSQPYRLVDAFQIERDEKTRQKPTYISNAIHTSKYTLLNFLPLCLLQEFRRSANLYFLVIAILQSIKQISPLTPVTAIAPLVMVVSVSLLREAIEDRKKRSSDGIINAKPVVVLRNFEELHVVWESIQVGDLVRIHEREAIPADGIILASSEENGSCFIDTSNLDGEANLKSRESLRATARFAFDKAARDKAKYFIKCEQPDQDLYRFAGNLSIDSKMYSLSAKQFLPRGSTLMNTKWAMMLVVYTGHDTKIMKNARAAHHKLSHLEIRMSRTVVFVFFIQVLLCAIAACVHHFQFSSMILKHVGDVDHSAASESVLLFLSFVVLMNTLIPISLVVTVEIIKTVHAKFITWDSKMRSSTGEGAIANTSSLTDELGQVKYIFTDKTGTLTQNQMVFRKCSVGRGIYVAEQKRPLVSGISISSLDALNTSATPSIFHSDDNQPNELPSISYFRRLLRNLESCESHLALAMSLCHTVVCEYDRATGVLSYNSDSPDECALVRGAEAMGVKLFERCGHKLYVAITEEDRHGSHVKTVTYTLIFQILRVVHFSSDRKRMSIIVRDENGGIKLLCKGADSVILERCKHFLSDKADTMSHVTQFAEEGFRILLFAERDLDENYYKSWEARYGEAELDIHSKEAKTQALYDEIEQNFTLIGASAVEDKLQVGVPETISLFQKAGIKIWVLTGDKLETSLEMGKLCRVVTPQMQEVIIQAATRSDMTQQLDKALQNSKESQAVLIDGSALTLALVPINRDKFLKLALQSATVIVCRASPIQKALVVELVKAGVPDVTLAVGDGANDVSMIRAAHVGVGVMGQEGMQAVRSADYSVQQFSHLGRLLLYHGRLSYLRTTQCIDYFFYKNIVFTLPQFIYGTASVFSGQTFFCDLYITAYNVVFTALPVTVRAVMETDLLEAIAVKFPELYRFGAADMFFSPCTMAKASTLAICHALVATVVPLLLAQHNNLSEGDSFWAASVASFFYIVPIVHFQIFCETWNWTWLVGLTYAVSLAGFLLCIGVYDHLAGDVEGVWRTVIVLPGFWIGFFLAAVACILPVVAYKCYEENFETSNPFSCRFASRLHVGGRPMAFLRRKKPNIRVPTGKDAVNFRKLLFLPVKDTEDLLANAAWERYLFVALLVVPLLEIRRRQEEEDEYQRQLDMLGGVWSFGSGFAGQLGHGDLESSGTPRIIKKLRGRSIAHVYAGFDSDVAFAVSRTGDVYVWGKRMGPTGLPPGSSLAALSKVTYGHDSDLDSDEEIGEEDTSKPANVQESSDVLIRESMGLSEKMEEERDELDEPNESDDDEEGGEEDFVHPVKLLALCGEGVSYIAVGRVHCCAATKDGDVFTWGQNDHCQLGTEPVHNLSDALSKKARVRYGVDSTEPRLWERTVSEACVIAAVDVGTNHTFVVTDKGEMMAFGATYNTSDHSSLARSIAKLQVSQISCGAMHAGLVTTDGQAYTWGSGDGGRLGHGDNTSYVNPKLVDALKMDIIVELACGTQISTTPGLVTDFLTTHALIKKVFTWGSNTNGCLGRPEELGELEENFCAVPGRVEGMENFVGRPCSIACGREFTLIATKPYIGASREEVERRTQEKLQQAESIVRQTSVVKDEQREQLERIRQDKRATIIALLNAKFPKCTICTTGLVCPGFQPNNENPTICRHCMHESRKHQDQHKAHDRKATLAYLTQAVDKLGITVDFSDIPDIALEEELEFEIQEEE
uniref:Phospholipid-transporting ATPase n=1 Tax=Phytophthora ramorum TaxID=164328 RepID=H3GLM7_PHYRM